MPKRTRIVATLGPATESEEALRAMIRAGMDVARINFSHAPLEIVPELVRLIRRLAAEAETAVGILGDLQGPRVRVGDVLGGEIELESGRETVLTPEAVEGTSERIPVTYPELAQDVEPGSIILVADGAIVLQVIDISEKEEVRCRIQTGGRLSNRRGINLPGRRVSAPLLAERDFDAIDCALANDFDFLALSFVQSVDDVVHLKRLLRERGSSVPIISKIEKRSAVDEIEAIVAESWGVMIGRGDLALEMGIEEVPVAQKRIITACRRAARPVITATQMLESMTHAPRPTRAEASDVANAILDGTDSLMLSGETAIGEFPAETVAMMSAIARETERAWFAGELRGAPELPISSEVAAGVAQAAQLLARSLGAKLIVVHTTSGSSARRVATHRPPMPVLGVAAFPETVARLTLCWGVESAHVAEIRIAEDLVQAANKLCMQRHGLKPGDLMILVAGTPLQESGRTNLIEVEEIPAD